MRVSFFVLSLLFVLLTGCVGKVPLPVAPDVVYPAEMALSVPAEQAVSDVVITVDPSVAAENLASLESHGTRQRIQNELMRRLAADGRYGSGGQLRLELTIGSYRMRSQASAVWNGAMAGADVLRVNGEVRRGDVTVKEFETGTSTVLAKPKTESDRLDKLVATLSKRIIEELDK